MTTTDDSEQEEAPLDQLTGYRVFRCGSCDRYFAAESVNQVNSCPYCGYRGWVATEEVYDVIKR